jgi:hypothetical protein
MAPVATPARTTVHRRLSLRSLSSSAVLTICLSRLRDSEIERPICKPVLLLSVAKRQSSSSTLSSGERIWTWRANDRDPASPVRKLPDCATHEDQVSSATKVYNSARQCSRQVAPINVCRR